jgi:hypothetical protein
MDVTSELISYKSESGHQQEKGHMHVLSTTACDAV